MDKEYTLEEQKNIIENEWGAYEREDEWCFWEETKFNIPKLTHNIWPTTNQWMNKETKSACTIVGTVNQLIREFALDMDYKTANNLAIEAVNYCTKYGYIVGHWWSVPDAVKYVCKWWNETARKRFNKEEVFYIRADYRDSRVKEYIEKWHLAWFSYALNYWDDRYKWLVYRNEYPCWTWHRTNRVSPSIVKSTWWASGSWCDVSVYDSYYLWTNIYHIKDRSKYMGKWMNSPAYIILPISCMEGTSVEQEKKRIEETKCLNYVVSTLSSSYKSLPEEFKKLASDLASKARNTNKDIKPINTDEEKKSVQSVIDALSYNWKFVWKETQDKFAELAKELRETYGIN